MYMYVVHVYVHSDMIHQFSSDAKLSLDIEYHNYELIKEVIYFSFPTTILFGIQQSPN